MGDRWLTVVLVKGHQIEACWGALDPKQPMGLTAVLGGPRSPIASGS